MVVNTRTISRDTADEVLDKAVQYAAIAGERDKTRTVCAILHKKHYDLGVLHTAEGIQAVFQVVRSEIMQSALFSDLLRQSCCPLGRLSVSSAPVGKRESRRAR